MTKEGGGVIAAIKDGWDKTTTAAGIETMYLRHKQG